MLKPMLEKWVSLIMLAPFAIVSTAQKVRARFHPPVVHLTMIFAPSQGSSPAQCACSCPGS